MVWWCPSGSPSVRFSVRPGLRPSVHFPHFSPTCFDILTWNFAHDFVLMYYRSSLSIVTLRQFFKELSLFWNLEYRKYTVFISPSSDGTYYGMVMSVRVSNRPTLRPSIRPSGSPSVRPFSALFSYILWHIELKFCIWLCFIVLQIKFECRWFASMFMGVMPPLELRILEIHSFTHFSLACFDIFSWNFAYDFVSPYYRSSSSVVNLH